MAMTGSASSKFLAYMLRHAPHSIGLALDENGWASVEELLARCTEAGKTLDRATLEHIVRTNNKKRFTLSPDGLRIRAAQGHSIEVALGLAPLPPPSILYHGTATRFLHSILQEGLKPGSRRQVHLSSDPDTALAVGQRHGKPYVLRVAAGEMHKRGIEFFCADNGVWLTDHVPAEFIED